MKWYNCLANIKRSQQGIILPIFVISLPVVLLVCGLVVDAGIVFVGRLNAQTVADAAALAGVQELDLDRLAKGERWINVQAAEAKAREIALLNLTENFGPLAASTTDIHVDVYNASKQNRIIHPRSGRVLEDPTVSVRVVVHLKPVFTKLVRDLPIRVEADASVVEKVER